MPNPSRSTRSKALSALALGCLSLLAQAQGTPDLDAPRSALVFSQLASPTGLAQTNYGAATRILDWNADGLPDLAVGAPGEEGDRGAVYLYLGPDLASPQRLVAADRAPGDRFGAFLGRCAIDARPGDELLVGAERKQEAGLASAGALYIYSSAASPIKLVAPSAQANAYFGCSAQTGDFDLDGSLDLVVAARSASAAGGGPAAGVLYFYEQDASGHFQPSYEIACPDQVPGAGQSELAAFGAQTSILEDASGATMGLFVTRIGAVIAPLSGRGAVDFIRVPMGPGATPMRSFFNLIPDEDQDGNYRWGMHLHARALGTTGFDLSVCHNRQDRRRADGSYATTAGSATHFRVIANVVTTAEVHGASDDGTEFVDTDHYGFRTQWLNLLGGPQPELVNMALGTPGSTLPRLYVYSASSALVVPEVVELPAGASHHAANGMSSGQLFLASSTDELVLGDPFFGPTSANGVGRVLILARR